MPKQVVLSTLTREELEEYCTNLEVKTEKLRVEIAILKKSELKIFKLANKNYELAQAYRKMFKEFYQNLQSDSIIPLEGKDKPNILS